MTEQLGEYKGWQNMLAQEVVASIGELKINTKSLNLVAGGALSGKTATCVNLAADAIIKRKVRVLYIDAEEKPILERAEPNFLKALYRENEQQFKDNFLYLRETKIERVLEAIEKTKPKFMAIDGLYHSFISEYSELHTMERSVRIRGALSKFREVVLRLGVGGVVTAPLEEYVSHKTKKREEFVLGGEGMKYLTDLKIIIKTRNGKKTKPDTPEEVERYYEIDKQICLPFLISYGGEITPIGHEQAVKSKAEEAKLLQKI